MIFLFDFVAFCVILRTGKEVKMTNLNIDFTTSGGNPLGSDFLDTIIRNEFSRLTGGQTLSDYDLSVVKDYLAFYWSCDWNLLDVQVAMSDCLVDCFDRHDLNDDDYVGDEYTIRNWDHFPMARRTIVDGHRVIKYRGGTATIYKQEA